MRLCTRRTLERLHREAQDYVIESLIRGASLWFYEHELFGTFEVKATVTPQNARSFYGTGDPVAELRRELVGKWEDERRGRA